jgi:hypothetical protein
MANKKQVPVAVEKAEFRLSDGTTIVWQKESKRWHVTLYKFSHDSRDVWSVGHLPTIVNAQYFAKKYPLKKND